MAFGMVTELCNHPWLFITHAQSPFPIHPLIVSTFICFLFTDWRERGIDLLLHLFMPSLVDSSMYPDWGSIRSLGVLGWHSNQLTYLTRAIFIFLNYRIIRSFLVQNPKKISVYWIIYYFKLSSRSSRLCLLSRTPHSLKNR